MELEFVLNTVVKLTEELGTFSNFVIVEEGLRLTTGLEAFGIRVVLVPTIFGTVTIVLMLLIDVLRGKVCLVAFPADIIKLPPTAFDGCMIVFVLLEPPTVPAIMLGRTILCNCCCGPVMTPI